MCAFSDLTTGNCKGFKARGKLLSFHWTWGTVGALPSLKRAALKHSASPSPCSYAPLHALAEAPLFGGLFNGGLQQRLSLEASARMTLQRRGEEELAGTSVHCDLVRSTFPPTALGLLSPPSPGPVNCRGFCLLRPQQGEPQTPDTCTDPRVFICATAWGEVEQTAVGGLSGLASCVCFIAVGEGDSMVSFILFRCLKQLL